MQVKMTGTKEARTSMRFKEEKEHQSLLFIDVQQESQLRLSLEVYSVGPH